MHQQQLQLVVVVVLQKDSQYLLLRDGSCNGKYCIIRSLVIVEVYSSFDLYFFLSRLICKKKLKKNYQFLDVFGETLYILLF